MASHDSKLERTPPRRDRFATTHWSVVLRAASNRSPAAAPALASLCEDYWFSLDAFVRWAGVAAGFAASERVL